MTEEKVGGGRGGKGPPDPLEALEAFKGNLSFLFSFCDFFIRRCFLDMPFKMNNQQ